VGGIDPDDIAIPSLLTEVLRAGVAKGVRDAAIGRNVNLSFVAIGRSINNGWIRWSVGEFDATGGGKARGGTPGHSTISGIQSEPPAGSDGLAAVSRVKLQIQYASGAVGVGPGRAA